MMPVAMPPAPAVATAILLLLQVPPGVVLERVVLVPGQMLVFPTIGATAGLTVSTDVLKQPGSNW